ncbi:hypothetical protein V2J74_27115 [Pseudomonas alliivorans]|nr:hypothetical protein [Pseudomonas alliivorans]
MTVDIEKLEALADSSQEWSEEIGEREWYAAGAFQKPYFSGPDAEFIAAASPAAVLELITNQKRMAARLLRCTSCVGQGEVYSGRTSYEGYNQPPEPIMDKCGECDGEGVLGDAGDCISILDEVETLRAELAGLKTGYEAYERVNAELRAECEGLRAKLENPDPILIQCLDAAIAEQDQLEKEAARYRWTSTEGNWVARMFGKWRAHIGAYGDASPTEWYETREEAIDAAMSKEASHD